MEELIETAHILRSKYSYEGDVHLKIIPGAKKEQIKTAMQLADRVSINIESATKEGLGQLSTTKDYKKDIIKRLGWIGKYNTKRNLVPSGHTTQTIIGVNDETDKQVIDQLNTLKEKYNIKNNYYSQFIPIKNTPFENREAEDPQRIYRLYQTEYLLDKYPYKKEDLVYDENMNLDLKNNPKYNMAVADMDQYPVDVNKAKFKQLLKIPGIGRKTAAGIMKKRKERKTVNSLKELRQMGANINECKCFVKINKSYQRRLI